MTKNLFNYPVASKKITKKTFHGQELLDEYEWMRDKNSPEVKDFLTEQNQLTAELTADTEKLQAEIFTEIKSRIQETDMSVPTKMDGYWYFTRTEEGKQYGISCRVKADSDDTELPPKIEPGKKLPAEETILDQNELAKRKDFFSLGALTVSRDGKQMFYSVDTSGDERYEIFQQDLNSTDPAKLIVKDTSGAIVLAPAADKLFYTTVDTAWRPDTLWCHDLQSTGADEKVFQENEESYWLSFGLSRSEKHYFLNLSSKITSEIYYLPVDADFTALKLVTPRKMGVDYHIEHAIIEDKNVFFKVTNENASNFKIEVAEFNYQQELTEFREYIPENPNRRIETIDTFADYLVLSYRENAVSKIAITGTAKFNNNFEPVEKDSPLEALELGGNPEFHTKTLRLVETSYINPTKVISYNPETKKEILLKQQQVLGGYNPDNYEQLRRWVTAPDGKQIPISIIKRKDTMYPAPTLQYGYGSYEISLDPGFSVGRLSLLDRGFVYVEAHIRGGGELGRNWYEEGKELNKKNTFTDFIAVSKFLIEENITTSKQLVAEGGSAGGLLMGAVANMAPELYAGILAEVPFVDSLTSILDPNLPLTVIEWDEWGNPLENPTVFEYMKSYAPYHNVKAQAYPEILAMTSLNDTRVLYVEPAKWVARLQENNTSDNPIMLKTEMVAGHGGVSGRYAKWKEAAFQLAWIIKTAKGIEL